MRCFAKQILVAAMLVAMVELPAAWANPALKSSAGSKSSPKPLGLVIQADSALVDNSVVSVGTTVFDGDALETQTGGTLRLRVGSSQMYLLATSAATLVQSAAIPQANILRGTLGFSTIASDQLEVTTPLGTIRGSKGAAYGQVRVVGPQEIVVTSFRGDLAIEHEGETYSVPSGKSFDVTLEPESQDAQGIIKAKNGGKDRKLKLAAIITGGAAIAAYVLWQEYSESCYGFKGC